jgi:hypothetical protein
MPFLAENHTSQFPISHGWYRQFIIIIIITRGRRRQKGTTLSKAMEKITLFIETAQL